MDGFNWADTFQVVIAFSGPLAVLFAGGWAVAKFAVNQLSKTIRAQFDAVNARFDAVDARFDAVDARFDAVDGRIDALSSEVAYLGRQVAGVKERVAHIEGRLGIPIPEPEQA